MSLPSDINPQLLALSSGYNLTRSLRFRASATAYLSRTITTNGTSTTWTYSTWVKRGTLGAAQDLFAYELFGKAGTYIDVGSGEPKRNNNTYMLETFCNWKGFSVDIGHANPIEKKNIQQRWTLCTERKNKIYWTDSLTFNYKRAIVENNLDFNIDFLSCDIDPQEKTFLALKKVLNDGIRPKYIAFETDYYKEKKDYCIIAYNFLKPLGYKIAIKNVCSNFKKNKIFETWFVKEEINFKTIEYFEWLKKK